MSTAYYPKASQVMERSLAVEELVIPFTITHNATPASKVLGTDEASILFLQTQGITQINSTSGALDSGEATPSFDLSAADSSGAFNMLVNVNPGGLYSYPPVQGDIVKKILSVSCKDRLTGTAFTTYINSTNPPLSANSDQMLINCASGINLATTDINGVMTITYTVNE